MKEEEIKKAEELMEWYSRIDEPWAKYRANIVQELIKAATLLATNAEKNRCAETALKAQKTQQRMWNKVQNLEEQVGNLKARIRAFEARERELYAALAKKKIYPRFLCTCMKSDCDCVVQLNSYPPKP